jgi:hypothetical protein
MELENTPMEEAPAVEEAEKQSALERMFAKMNVYADQVVEEARAAGVAASSFEMPKFYYNVSERAYMPLKQPRTEEEWLEICRVVWDDYDQISEEDPRFARAVRSVPLPTHEARFKWMWAEQDKLMKHGRMHIVHCSPLLFNAAKQVNEASVRHAVGLGCGGDHAFVAVRVPGADADDRYRLGAYSLLEEEPVSSAYHFLDPESPEMTEDVKEGVQAILAKDVTIQKCKPVIAEFRGAGGTAAASVPRIPLVWGLSRGGRALAVWCNTAKDTSKGAVEGCLLLFVLDAPGSRCVARRDLADAFPAARVSPPALIAVSDRGDVAVAFNESYAFAPGDKEAHRMPPHVQVVRAGGEPPFAFVPAASASTEKTKDVPHVSLLSFSEEDKDAETLLLHVGSRDGALYSVGPSGHVPPPRRLFDGSAERYEFLKRQIRAPPQLWWTQGLDAPVAVSSRLVGPAGKQDRRELLSTTQSLYLSTGTEKGTAEEVARTRQRADAGKNPLQVHHRSPACVCVSACGNLLAAHRWDGALLIGDMISGRPFAQYPERLDDPNLQTTLPYRSIKSYCDRTCCLLANGALVFVLPNDAEHQRQFDETRRKVQEGKKQAREEAAKREAERIKDMAERARSQAPRSTHASASSE